MCLAIYKPKGVEIPEDNLRSGWLRNPDGGGFAYISDNKIVVRKGFLKYQDFLTDYKEAFNKHRDSPFLVHFRIRSMGDKSAGNTHPHVYKHGVMIHNGTLTGTGAASDKGKSDTALFLERYGDNFTYQRLADNVESLAEAVGSWNKFVFLFKNGDKVIVNEKAGHWINGVWYSNSYSLPPEANRACKKQECY